MIECSVGGGILRRTPVAPGAWHGYRRRTETPEQRDRSHRPFGKELKQMLAERTKREAAEEATRKEALRIVERWNRALAAGRGELWSPTIPGRFPRWNAVARREPPGMPH
jgi:hypothetical protein